MSCCLVILISKVESEDLGLCAMSKHNLHFISVYTEQVVNTQPWGIKGKERKRRQAGPGEEPRDSPVLSGAGVSPGPGWLDRAPSRNQ